MKPNRHRLAGLLASTVSLCLSCGGLADGSAAHADGDPPAEDASDAGRAPADASPAHVATGLDSKTLRVDVSIVVDPSSAPGLSIQSVPVELVVVVTESATGAPVSDAEVRGGPLGHPVPLGLVSMQAGYTDGNLYRETVTGYVRSWELSVVRGRDQLTGVVLTGPSYPAVTFSPGPASATVGWSPAGGPGVTTQVCAVPFPSQTSDWFAWCTDDDRIDGSAVLTPSDEVEGRTGAFPVPGADYQITVEENLGSIPVGSQAGTGRFQVIVGVIATADRRCG
jgi:hypothetical protein